MHTMYATKRPTNSEILHYRYGHQNTLWYIIGAAAHQAGSIVIFVAGSWLKLYKPNLCLLTYGQS